MCCIFLTPCTKIFTKYFTKYCTVSYTVFTRLLSIEACVPILHVNLRLLDLLITCASPTRRRRSSTFTTRTTGADMGVGAGMGTGAGTGASKRRMDMRSEKGTSTGHEGDDDLVELIRLTTVRLGRARPTYQPDTEQPKKKLKPRPRCHRKRKETSATS
jgi:hypothetical protein